MIGSMTRLPTPTVLLLLLLAAAAPAFAGKTKTYKCVVDGKTVYQDHPCANLAPEATVATPAPALVSAPPRVARSPAQIYDEIQMARRHERELSEGYKRDEELARTRLAAMDAKRRQLETQQLDARWLPRIQVQRQKAERLQAELRLQCPGGASMRAGHFECSR